MHDSYCCTCMMLGDDGAADNVECIVSVSWGVSVGRSVCMCTNRSPINMPNIRRKTKNRNKT